MLKKKTVYITIWALGILSLAFNHSFAQNTVQGSKTAASDSTGVLVYPFDDEGAFEYPGQIDKGPLYLNRPANIERKIEYDPVTKQYVIYEKIGGIYYRLPKTMGLKEYVKYDFGQSIKDYWRTRKEAEEIATGEKSNALIPQIKIESEAFTNIFGSDIIDIKPQGYVEVSFGAQSNYNGNPLYPERLRRTTNFDFDNQINIGVRGKIGEKVNMEVNFNSEATFDFDNKMKIDYTGKEDEILRKIEAGNVSLPLNGTLIQGGTNLMGIKTEMQFGKLNLTTIVSKNNGESQVIETEGGAQKTSFEIQASDYDENRHFFLSKYFRDNYNKALSKLPKIYTQVIINKVEVWVTNTSQNFTEARDIIGFVDLGEQDGNISNNIPEFGPASGMGYPANTIPHNGANNLYQQLTEYYSGIRQSKLISRTMSRLEARGFKDGTYWGKIDQARKLNASEYFINQELGFISLNGPLNNDEVLAVAFNFTIGDSTYQVGEFSTNAVDSKQTLILKLLKGTRLSPELPTWDFMMKNVYNLGAYDLSNQDFDFNIVYKNELGNFVNSLPAGELNEIILLRVMNLDNLNTQLDYAENGDGMYDFIEGVTVISQSGRIIFPVLEPFGANIADRLSDKDLKKKFAFDSLYSSTKYSAEQDYDHNKFYMVGSYKGSSSSEISLNTFNLAPGSVKVVAGSTELTENIDYTVDYAMGKVKIINQSYIDAGTPIQVSTESQDMISMQRKTLIGTYGSYAASEKLNIGGTLLYMNERPMTNKVDMGEEPVSNLMLGLDFQYRDRSQLLTDLVNLLPFYESKTESSISIEAEVAKLFPGSSKLTGNNVYIDDFEGVETSIPLSNAFGWQLASTPRDQQALFPEANFSDSLVYGYNRAKLSWYHIAQLFTEAGTSSPAHIKADIEMRSNHYMRTVTVQEIFPGKQNPLMTSSNQTIFNLAYFPSDRGPYNYDAEPVPGISEGIGTNGKLKEPETRWGGIMRDIQSPNFESQNIEYIEFWLLDPFIYNPTHAGGDLYINLGDISEDVLRDSRKAFENGLPVGEEDADIDTTAWGRVSNDQMLKQAFTTSDAESRSYQDVGFDGLRDEDEKSFFKNYLNKIEQQNVSKDAYEKILADPSADDFHYYRGDDYDKEKLNIIDRYKNYNGLEGNTPVNQSQNDIEGSSQTGPDVEDLNKDNTMNESEAYYQYRVSLRPEDMVLGRNHIVDKVRRKTHTLPNGKSEEVTWYQFKIPVKKESEYEKIGNISGFRSIRFIRMFLKNFEDSVILRFGTLSLIRSDWMVEKNPFTEVGVIDPKTEQFEMTSINIEENQSRKPINYILPPGIEREVDPTNPTPIEMNEQSMLLKVKNLEPGVTKAVYKNVGLDMRQYKKLKMEVHAEAIEGFPLKDYELSLVVRLGSDYENYYEYEIPLKLTPIPPTTYVGNEVNSPHRYVVWPNENRMDLDLTIFPDLKLNRDEKMRKAGSTISQTTLYEEIHKGYQGDKNIIRIKGNPTIGEVEVIHIGIKNPKNINQVSKSAEIWVNELRLSDFDEKGGWASNLRMSLRLADLGSVSLSGRTESVGWGGINQAASQRSLENTYQYDIAANIELGKLAPEKIGLHLPIYYNLSQSVSSPQYNPLSSDIKMTDALALIESPEEKNSLKSISQDVNTRKSLTINNVTLEPERKKANRKSLPTDIENFSVSYSNSSQEVQSIDIAEQIYRNEKASFDYNYSITSQPFEPLKKVKFLDNDFLRIIKEFNFSYLPEMISFRTDFQKNYNQRKARDNSGMNIDLPRTIQKDFVWNRNFDLRYNITRNLKFDFTNSNINRIDQMDGLEDRNIDPTLYDEIQRELWKNIRTFGRPVDYEHSVDIQYTVPINLLPLLDFTSTRLTYRGNYEWLAGPVLAPSESIEVGNTIRNGMNINATANFNLLTLYNKVPYLKDVNQKYQTSTRRYGSKNKANSQKNAAKEAKEPKESKTKEVKFNDKKVSFKANVPKSIFHKLGTEKVRILVLSNKGDTIKGETSIVNENRINFKTEKSVADAEVFVVGTIDNSEPLAKKLLDGTTRVLLGIRSIRASYSQNGGTEMPGFLGQPQTLRFGAQDFTPPGSTVSSLAPGIPFLLGWQDSNFGLKAADNGWISEDTTITKRFLDQKTETWTFGLQVEPFSNIKIDVTGNRRESKNNSSFIQYNTSKSVFEQLSKKETGNFEMSVFTLRTAFKEGLGDTLVSELFNQFRGTNRQVILNRINQQRGYVEGEGYSKSPYAGDTMQGVSLNSSDVIIPAFIAAYTGIDASKIPLTARPGLAWIRPNWRINYNGDPQSIDWMKEIFTSLNFTHSYRANYSIGSFETNLAYKPDESGLSWVKSQFDKETYFVPQLDINSVNIQEDFSPLINIDAAFVNDLSANFEIRRTRTLNFSFSNMQLSEMIKNEYSVGVGYRFTGLDMIIKTKRKSESVSNDVNMRLELTSSDFKTTFRKIDEEKGILQSGMKLFSVDFQADYMISDKLTIKLYYNYRLQDPHLVGGSEGFIQKETKFGLSFNYSIM